MINAVKGITIYHLWDQTAILEAEVESGTARKMKK